MGRGKPSPDTCLSVYFLITRYSQKTPSQWKQWVKTIIWKQHEGPNSVKDERRFPLKWLTQKQGN